MLDNFKLEHAIALFQLVSVIVVLNTRAAVADLKAHMGDKLNQHVVDFHRGDK